MVESENHAGVCFWGLPGPLVIFPNPSMWDYIGNKGIRIYKPTAEKVTSQHEWVKVEILAQGNRVRAAFNGVQVMEWREADLGRIKEGPIGIQLHGSSSAQEVLYKDIVVETFPREDRLVTLPMTPAILPGAGLAQHDFFYAGEQKQHQMYIVKKGKVVWSYIDANSRGEISDAVLMSDGNILFAHQYGVSVMAPDKHLIWNYDAPAGTETHTAQPIGKDHVLFIQNGDPAILRVVNIRTNKTVREFGLSTGNPKSVHGQFRHARLTDAGTVLVAHMDNKKVVEYDDTGKEVWSVAIESPWSAERLKNGNTLIATNKKLVREVNPKGETVWEVTAADVPDYLISGFQIATRLANGNTLVNNWLNSWNTAVDRANGPVQALEFTPDKKLVWALRAWTDPADLGPATTIQVLDGPQKLEQVHFGDIR